MYQVGAPRDSAAGHIVSIAVSASLCAATFLLTRQTQIPALNSVGAPWAVLLAIAWLQWKPSLLSLLPMVSFASLSMLASLVMGNDAANAIRFFVITITTLLAFHFKPARIASGWVLLPLAIQAVLVISVSLWLSVMQDDELATLVRAYIRETTWGDIYSFDGIYYRVQLIGNALLPLLFLISLWKYRQRRLYRILAVLSFLSVVAAGNLTYEIAAALGVLIRVWKPALGTTAGRFAIGISLVSAIVFSWSTADEMLERKFDGSDSSMGIRFDQIDVALEAWKASPVQFLIGSGLGAGFPDGRERDYSQFQYIELQALYLTVQLGQIGILIYLSTLVFSVHRFLDTDGRRIFWLYALSGCTNPTILDANQIIATVLLVCLFPRKSANLAGSVHHSSARVLAEAPSR